MFKSQRRNSKEDRVSSRIKGKKQGPGTLNSQILGEELLTLQN